MQGRQLSRGSALSSCFTKKEEVRQDLPGSIEVAKNMFKAFYGVRSAKPPEQKRIGLDVLPRFSVSRSCHFPNSTNIAG